jgi:hypothetical protein
MANARTLTIGLVVLGLGCFFTYDSFSKSMWTHTEAKVMSVDTACEMKAVEYGILVKTTSTATIDCSLTDAFQNLHTDKSWTVTKIYTAHVLVGPKGSVPTATTMPVGGEVKPGATLQVVQSPTSSTRVQLASTVAGGLGFGWIIVAGGVLLTLLGFFQRSRQQKAIAALQAMVAEAAVEQQASVPAPAARTQSAFAASAPAAGRRAFGRLRL